MTPPHVPVLVDAVLRFLIRPETRIVFDGTVGAGGHAAAILESRDDIELIAMDRDPRALALARRRLERYGSRVRLVEGVFADVDRVLAGVGRVDGVLLDLGVSSMQLDSPERGFSYRSEGPLDMRMSGDLRSARTLIDELDVGRLAGILREYGEVRRPRRVASAIRRAAEAGEMVTTGDLRAAVARALGGRADPAELSRVFQALRIAVNRELDQLDAFLERIPDRIRPGGRVVVIAYHSLEDRRVKTVFRRESRDCICPPHVPVCACGHRARIRVLTRHPVRPDVDEVARNPRARSARLRAAERLEAVA